MPRPRRKIDTVGCQKAAKVIISRAWCNVSFHVSPFFSAYPSSYSTFPNRVLAPKRAIVSYSRLNGPAGENYSPYNMQLFQENTNWLVVHQIRCRSPGIGAAERSRQKCTFPHVSCTLARRLKEKKKKARAEGKGSVSYPITSGKWVIVRSERLIIRHKTGQCLVGRPPVLSLHYFACVKTRTRSGLLHRNALPRSR